MSDEERLPLDDSQDSEEAPELDLFAQLNEASNEDEAEFADDGVSLEELSQSYANAIGSDDTTPVATDIELFDEDEAEDCEEDELASDDTQVTPQSIVEAALFVGRPDNSAITAAELAKLMRGVNAAEVTNIVADLNSIYESTGRATRIVESPEGFCTELASDLEFVRERFYGRTREISLNQSAIDCLALIAYQPGITRDKLEHQRGQPSGGILNQLVRRQLIEMHRKSDGKKKAPHYYPTDKLLELAGLVSLEDLPQVEDLDPE